MTLNEMVAQLKQEVKGLTSSLEDVDYTNAISASERDTGWSLPQTAAFNIKWLMERAKRHLFFFLMSESASKFKFKNINLQNRFEHYRLIIKDMDERIKESQEEFAFEFAGVSATQIAGSVISAGFQTDPLTGEDTTYDSTNKVLIHPNGNS